MEASLSRLFRARSPGEFDDLLGRLIEADVAPAVRAVVRARLGGGRATPDDAEDVSAEAVAAVVSRLRGLQNGSSADSIGDVTAYSRTVAKNACDAFFRKAFPVRASLSAQVMLRLKEHPGFRLVVGPGGERFASFEAWANREPAADRRKAEMLTRDLGRCAAHVRDSLPAGADLAKAMAAALDWFGGPMPVEGLVALCGELTGKVDSVATEPRDDDPDPVASIAAETPALDTQMTLQDQLRAIWAEIALLPPNQAKALLLNFRDDRRRGVLDFLLLTGTATQEQIAEAMEMTTQELADLWEDLPLDDAALAERLGCRPIDVSNLRSVARRRLSRRLGPDFFGGDEN